jgi:hypothetical protein
MCTFNIALIGSLIEKLHMLTPKHIGIRGLDRHPRQGSEISD